MVETEDEDDTDFSGIFEVFSTEHPQPKQQQATANAPGNRTHLPPQPFRYQSDAEDPALISELEELLWKGNLSAATPMQVLAASPAIWKNMVEQLWTK